MGGSVTLVGKLDSMSNEAFSETIERMGGRFTHAIGPGTRLVVVGQRNVPLALDATLPRPLRKLRV